MILSLNMKMSSVFKNGGTETDAIADLQSYAGFFLIFHVAALLRSAMKFL